MRTYEYEEHYIIYPHYDWWDSEDIIPGGKLVERGFAYSSGTNKHFLTVAELREKLKTDLDRY
jgi:hypothetical protein